MEVALPGPLALDCEDMFKEITKKLYGEEGALEFPDRIDQEDGSLLKPEDHITAFGLAALMQNGFPPPGILQANFQPKTNPAAEDKWSASEESLQWTNSRIATYNPAQKLFKCGDCECVGFLSRIAEHWLGTHSNARVFQCPQCAYGSAWARCVRLHLVREHNMPDDRGTDALVRNNPVLDEVTKYLQRLKAKIDSMAPSPESQGQMVQRQQVSPTNVQGAAPNKRYGCPSCPYATDRRDLFTRHENIHRDEKPFECYVCQKQFNRADHVKKHFLRMHRDHPYDLNRIRRQIPKSPPNTYYQKQTMDPMQGNMQMQTDQSYTVRPHGKEHSMHQIKSEHEQNAMAKNPNAKKKGEKRYSCCYCSWSGVDNWCLKRHLNTHLKPFICGLCDYKAARSERLATHVTKVHNKKACSKCTFLAEDQNQLAIHLQEQHHVENRNIKVPNTMLRPGYSGGPSAPVMSTFGSSDGGNGNGNSLASMRSWRPPRQQGAARLFNYMEASDGSDQEDFDSKVYSTDERTIQDFPEAGDVGTNSAGKFDPTEPSATTAIVTSPAELTKRPDKKKQPKKKKTGGNKENATKCNTNGANEQSRNPAARSPLSSNNERRFTFDADEGEPQSKRSRKQRQPKKVVQEAPIASTSQKPAPPFNEMFNENSSQLDDIILKIVKKKETTFDSDVKPKIKPPVPKRRHYRPIKPNRSKPFIVFRCKRCNLKFKPNYEFYLHYKYCRSKRRKSVQPVPDSTVPVEIQNQSNQI